MTSTKKTKSKKYRNVPANLTSNQLDGLDKIAKEDRKTRSEVVRDAIDYYLIKYGKETTDLHETEMVRQMKRIEQGIRTLLVKNIKLTAQTQYWSMLPWVDGPPKSGLVQEGIDYHMDRASFFAAAILKGPQHATGDSENKSDKKAG